MDTLRVHILSPTDEPVADRPESFINNITTMQKPNLASLLDHHGSLPFIAIVGCFLDKHVALPQPRRAFPHEHGDSPSLKEPSWTLFVVGLEEPISFCKTEEAETMCIPADGLERKMNDPSDVPRRDGHNQWDSGPGVKPLKLGHSSYCFGDSAPEIANVIDSLFGRLV